MDEAVDKGGDTHSTETSASGNGSALRYFIDHRPTPDDFLAAILDGFSKPQKTLPAKFFYDREGSRHFDAICETDEYYVTRTEVALLGDIGPEVADLAGPGAVVVEYGCGSNLKIRTLLDGLSDAAEYVAIDISRQHLREAAEEIADEYPDLKVGAICADFTDSMELPDETGRPRLGFFPGSTIGNQTRIEARTFLAKVRRHVGDDGALLIGVDLKKDEKILDAAYNDAAGHTAAFNLNVLARANRELDADIDLDSFVHKAFYNPDEGRVEMHLMSTRRQTVEIGGEAFDFAEGETIHTESSHKYTVAEFGEAAETAGFSVARTWTDPKGLFSIHYLSAAQA
jgi:dimethylhistidine N-methyltransferase